MVEACASVSGSMGLLGLILGKNTAWQRHLSRLASLRPVGGDGGAVTGTPAAPACLFETLRRTLDQRKLDTTHTAFRRHGAQVLDAGINGEGGTAATRALELGRDH